MRFRTTAIGVLLAAALAVQVSQASGGPPSQIVFPVLGGATYIDDFGQPRSGGPHQGNDLIAPRKAIAVAAESGKVTFWTTSASAGCMLYLYGDSGTTYLYIHLNNDVGTGNDNKGKCVPGTAYASGLHDGDRVGAGEPVGFVGDSGDANGHPHLHFEVHPNDGPAVDPYPYLRKAVHLLFPVDPKATVSLTAEGSVTGVQGSRLTLAVTKLTLFPGSQEQVRLGRPLVLSVPSTAQMDNGDGSIVPADSSLLQSLTGKNVVVLSSPTRATLDVALARPGAIKAARIAAVTAAPRGGR
jgi:hypothetical protein